MYAVLDTALLEARSLPRPHAPHADPIVVAAVESPVGPLVMGAIGAGVCLVEFHDRPALPGEGCELAQLLSRPVVTVEELEREGGAVPGRGHLEALERELIGYFEGSLRSGFTVPLVTPGTLFERRVWAALLEIPYGETVSYGRLATRLGATGAARAVGRANGRNRIAIVVPCHRVIQEDGTLCGYGGGLPRKRFLLDLERDATRQPGLFAEAEAERL